MLIRHWCLVKTFTFLRVVSFLASLFFSSVCTAQQSSNATPIDQIKFDKIDNDRIMEIGAIWDIEQDEKGFIWLAGENGLARYDGYEVEIYRNIEGDYYSLSSSFIYDLQLGEDGNLWIATT